jgi:hypothetical protein
MAADRTDGRYLKGTPIGASILAGFIASLCCGGSLVFGSIGLGAFYSALGLSHYIPQALAIGAFAIAGINYLFYRRLAKDSSSSSQALRRTMLVSAGLGLVAMAAGFIFMEWLNHGVVHADHFLVRPEYKQGLITGVPNISLLYVGATFFALALLWALPFPASRSAGVRDRNRSVAAMRMAIFGAMAILVAAVALDAVSKSEVAGAAAGGQHGHNH